MSPTHSQLNLQAYARTIYDRAQETTRRRRTVAAAAAVKVAQKSFAVVS